MPKDRRCTHNGWHDKALEEKALATVSVVFKDEEVSIRGDLTTYGSHCIYIKELQGRAVGLLTLFLVLTVCKKHPLGLTVCRFVYGKVLSLCRAIPRERAWKALCNCSNDTSELFLSKYPVELSRELHNAIIGSFICAYPTLIHTGCVPRRAPRSLV